MAEPIAVRVRDCACPGTPHAEGDVVYVAPTASLRLGLAVEADTGAALAEVIANAGPAPSGGWNEGNSQSLAVSMTDRLRRRYLETYVRFGTVGWNFEDEDGPMPFDAEVLLADYALGQPIAERCDELYGETVTRPLLARLNRPSGPGRTRATTSAKVTPIRPRRKSSSPATSAASRQSVG
ncbi:MAG: hypothetical protein ABI678_05040 [Kofleriaceae bacterium]